MNGRDFYSPLDRIPEIIGNLTGKNGTRPLAPEELAVIGEMPTVRHGQLTSQRRVATAIAALKELQPDELLTALQSLDQIKGRVWAAGTLRKAADNVEIGK